jgi:hypothetical protein
MSSITGAEAMSEELRSLGSFHRLFDASVERVWAATLRGVFPMAIAGIMLLAAQRYLVPRSGKFFLVCFLATGLFLNGIRVIAQAWRRRQQKIALFENGFALWRNRVLSTYFWREVQELEVSPSFFGFTAVCRRDDGQVEKIHFDAASDPTNQLRELCHDLESHVAHDRIPGSIAQIDAGEEVIFVRKVWGKEVGTKIGVSRSGLCITPRYKTARCFPWEQIASVTAADGNLVIHEVGDDVPLLSESILAIPQCARLVATAEHARRVAANPATSPIDHPADATHG